MNKRILFFALLLVTVNSFGDGGTINTDYCKKYRYYNVQKTVVSHVELSLFKITCNSNNVTKEIPLVTTPYDTVNIPSPFFNGSLGIGTLERGTYIWADSASTERPDARYVVFAIYAVNLGNSQFILQ